MRCSLPSSHLPDSISCLLCTLTPHPSVHCPLQILGRAPPVQLQHKSQPATQASSLAVPFCYASSVPVLQRQSCADSSDSASTSHRLSSCKSRLSLSLFLRPPCHLLGRALADFRPLHEPGHPASSFFQPCFTLAISSLPLLQSRQPPPVLLAVRHHPCLLHLQQLSNTLRQCSLL